MIRILTIVVCLLFGLAATEGYKRSGIIKEADLLVAVNSGDVISSHKDGDYYIYNINKYDQITTLTLSEEDNIMFKHYGCLDRALGSLDIEVNSDATSLTLALIIFYAILVIIIVCTLGGGEVLMDAFSHLSMGI